MKKLFIIAAMLVSVTPAFAQTKTSLASTITGLMNQVQSVKAEIITNVVADITAADADAVANNDVISHACYPAAAKFLQSLPVATAPTGTYTGVQLFQKKRDFTATLQAGLPTYLKLGCSALIGDEINTFVTLMNMVGVKILPAAATALFPALAPITLPALAIAQ